MTRGRFNDYVAHLVDQAPQLTADTEATLRQLLTPTGATPTQQPLEAVESTERTPARQRRPAA